MSLGRTKGGLEYVDGRMYDEHLRRRLVSYLTARPGDVRVEVSIGTVRADVVLLTDRISGFEIKGDSDPIMCKRFQRQTVEYNNVFDFCWLVISGERGKAKTAEKKLPEHWGIIHCPPGIGGVQFVRHARPNLHQSIAHLSGQLWLSQLRQLLWRNGINGVAQRKKDYMELATALPIDVVRAKVIEEWRRRKVLPNENWHPRKRANAN